MKTYQLVLIGIGAAIAMIATGAIAVYYLRTSSQRDFQAYAKGSHVLVTTAAVAQRLHDDSLIQRIAQLVAGVKPVVVLGQHHDTLAHLDSGTVADLRRSLAEAVSVLDSAHRAPPVIAALDTQVYDLTLARNAWRTAFDTQAAATAQAIALHSSDTLWRNRLIAHIDSLPKPPRTPLWRFLLPKPYVKAEYGTKYGKDLRAGICLGACGP